MKLILGVGESLIGRLVLFDGLELRVREVRVEKDPSCAVCGERPTILSPVDYDDFCRVGEQHLSAATGDVPSVTVEDLRASQQAGESVELLDVREAHEFEIVRIPGARSFPLSELPARLHELDSARTYTISCHHGIRSRQAFEFLRRAGFARLRILDGGVDAWAERIDPSLPRY
jgi:adenylyltransferase/sulfurtransferase